MTDSLADSMPVHTIRLGEHQLKYSISGEATLPPLILVHGWGSHRGVWRQTVEALKSRFHCVAVDLLGFGDSDKPAKADYNIKAQAERILQLADALGFERFVLSGHSMGGQIALCTAAMLAPDRITQLVSVSGVVTGRLMRRVETVTYNMIALGRVLPWGYHLTRWLNRYRSYAYFQFRPWFYKMDSLPFDSWAVDRYMINQPGIHLSLYEAGQAMHRLNLTPYLNQIKSPTLVIFGQQDGTVPVSDGQLVAHHVPGSQLALIDSCGHFPMYEQTRQYLDILLPFLQ